LDERERELTERMEDLLAKEARWKKMDEKKACHELDADVTSVVGDLTTATGGLSSAIASFALVAMQVERSSRELKEREARVEEREREVAARLEELQDREAQWKEVEDGMEKNAERAAHQITLNVGGKRFTTTKYTLLQHRGSYFESLIISNHSCTDKNGEYFIDHDPKHFRLVLNYLRDGRLRNTELRSIDMVDLIQEFQFYKIEPPASLVRHNNQTSLATDNSQQKNDLILDPEGGTLLSDDHVTKLAEWLPHKRFLLLYKATKDGFQDTNFHQRCDNRGPTLTVIQAHGGHLFGGYTAASWDCSEDFRADPTAFLFTLANPHAIPPTAYPARRGHEHRSIYCSGFACAVFGAGYDVAVNSASHQFNDSPINFPSTFVDTTGKGSLTFTGAPFFTTSEVEVYSVI